MCMMSWFRTLNDDAKEVFFEWYEAKRHALTEKIESLEPTLTLLSQLKRQIRNKPPNWRCDEEFCKVTREKMGFMTIETPMRLEVGMTKFGCMYALHQQILSLPFEENAMKQELEDLAKWKVDVLKQAPKTNLHRDNDAISTKRGFLLNNPFLVKI